MLVGWRVAVGCDGGRHVCWFVAVAGQRHGVAAVGNLAAVACLAGTAVVHLCIDVPAAEQLPNAVANGGAPAVAHWAVMAAVEPMHADLVAFLQLTMYELGPQLHMRMCETV